MSPGTVNFETTQQRETMQSIPGLNVQWAICDNIRCAHELQLWNGTFSSFVPVKVMLTDSFFIEAVYYTEDLPELSVYPLSKLYFDPKSVQAAGFLKRAYITMRSRYYFCNLSTTASGGGHNELVRTPRERFYTYTKTSQLKGRKGTEFLRKLLATLQQALKEYDERFVAYIRSLPGYEQLYDPSPPHFDLKIRELVFATDITGKMEDCFVHYDRLKFTLDR